MKTIVAFGSVASHFATAYISLTLINSMHDGLVPVSVFLAILLIANIALCAYSTVALINDKDNLTP